jgi:hypothetical protein
LAATLVQFIFLAADLLEVLCLPAVVEVLVYKTNHLYLVTTILEVRWPAVAAVSDI